MKPTVKPICRKRGDDRRHNFQIVDENEVAVDITAWTNFIMSAHSVQYPTDLTTEVFRLNGSIYAPATDGRGFFVPPQDIVIPDGENKVTLYYDAQGTDANGEVITFLEGTYTVTQDRTK